VYKISARCPYDSSHSAEHAVARLSRVTIMNLASCQKIKKGNLCTKLGQDALMIVVTRLEPIDCMKQKQIQNLAQNFVIFNIVS